MPGAARGSRLPRWSVRTRLTLAMALLTAAALAGAGLVVWRLETARLEGSVHERIDQEMAEFEQLHAGNDPETARPFDDVRRLLDVFLSRNVPDRDELLLGYVVGTPAPSSATQEDDPRLRLLDEPAYEDALDDLVPAGGTRSIDTGRFGEVWLTAVPVQGSPDGSLMIASFVDREASRLDQTMRTYALVALSALLLITLLAATQSGRLLRPLRTLRDTAREVTATDLTRRIPETGRDDVTELTRTINDMLDRLEAGFTAQRDFLDDAGHELRTPLTVLRGHLEVLRHGDARDVEETRALLLDEVDRMSRLVDDLVLLAKSRRPDFVRLTPVDVGPLTRGLLAKAAALGDRDWRLDEAAELTARLDEQRVTQAVLELARNAVKHTCPGDLVALGSSADGHDLRLWVRDGGPGVPRDDRRRIFERFGRSVVRGDDGFGLGLSIVTAIAAAHGGTAHVSDNRPRGACFVITIPMEDGPWHTS